MDPRRKNLLTGGQKRHGKIKNESKKKKCRITWWKFELAKSSGYSEG